MTRYIVKSENTLGYIIDPDFCPPGYMSIGILHGSILRGSLHGPLDGWTICHESETRPATLADFEAYRVNPPKGWIAHV